MFYLEENRKIGRVECLTHKRVGLSCLFIFIGTIFIRHLEFHVELYVCMYLLRSLNSHVVGNSVKYLFYIKAYFIVLTHLKSMPNLER